MFIHLQILLESILGMCVCVCLLQSVHEIKNDLCTILHVGVHLEKLILFS